MLNCIPHLYHLLCYADNSGTKSIASTGSGSGGLHPKSRRLWLNEGSWFRLRPE